MIWFIKGGQPLCFFSIGGLILLRVLRGDSAPARRNWKKRLQLMRFHWSNFSRSECLTRTVIGRTGFNICDTHTRAHARTCTQEAGFGENSWEIPGSQLSVFNLRLSFCLYLLSRSTLWKSLPLCVCVCLCVSRPSGCH